MHQPPPETYSGIVTRAGARGGLRVRSLRKGAGEDAREEATGRQQLGGDDAITTKIGAVTLPLAVIVLVVTEYFHPSREDPMDFPAVFMEYAHSDIWTAVHLGEYFGFLLLLGGLVALYYSVSAKPGVGAGL